MADKKQNEPEKTVGKEKAPVEEPAPATESANGASSAEAVKEDLKEKTAEIADTYEKAKQELNDAVSRLRYEVSKLDVDQARQRARTWVEENPTLAVLLAVGAGIVVGRLLSEALKPAPPPPLSQRLKARGRALASQAQHVAHDVGDVVGERAADLGDVIARRAHELGEDVTRRAHEFGEDVTRRAVDVVSAASERASGLGEIVQQRAAELPGTAKEKTGRSLDLAESLVNAAKTITAAVVVKKVTDWLRRVS